MLCSGNDCAIAISEHIAGSVEEFSTIMNSKALELGLKNSNFTSPHGLDDENHYTTAYELALITDYALNNPTFKNIVSTKQKAVTISGKQKTISNTNELLGYYDGVYGVKTGFTFNAGRCLVTSCKRNGLNVIVVVLGANSKRARTIDSVKVLNYCFTNYSKVDISNIIYEEFDKFENYLSDAITVQKSTDKPIVCLGKITNTVFPLKSNELNSISSELFTLNTLSAPTYANTKIGEISIKIDNNILVSTDILIKNDLSKKTWKQYYKELLKNFFKV